jgi:hypothetical protein
LITYQGEKDKAQKLDVPVMVAGVQVPDVTPVVPLQRGSLADREVSEKFKVF